MKRRAEGLMGLYTSIPGRILPRFATVPTSALNACFSRFVVKNLYDPGGTGNILRNFPVNFA